MALSTLLRINLLKKLKVSLRPFMALIIPLEALCFLTVQRLKMRKVCIGVLMVFIAKVKDILLLLTAIIIVIVLKLILNNTMVILNFVINSTGIIRWNLIIIIMMIRWAMALRYLKKKVATIVTLLIS